jgi:excisionase family DNA binding protein
MAVVLAGTPAHHFRQRGQRRRTRIGRKLLRRGIKLHRTYTVEEAAIVTGCAKGTIRRWIRAGALPALTDQKPHLILGGDLLDYLKARVKRGPHLKPHECYCLKCRAPREPALGMAEYIYLTPTTGNLRALCSICTTVMHKAVALDRLRSLTSILDVTMPQATKHIMDSPCPSLDDHFPREGLTDA